MMIKYKTGLSGLMSILIIVAFVVCVGLVLFFILQNKNNSSIAEIVNYNNYNFTSLDEGKWLLTLQDFKNHKEYDIPLYYNPTQLDDVYVSGNLLKFYSLLNANHLNAVYVTFDPGATNFSSLALASAELSLNLAQVLNITPIAACTKNDTDACSERPIVDCSMKDRMVIYLKESPDNFTHVMENFNCFTIEGKDRNLLKAVDRFLFELYGVMKN